MKQSLLLSLSLSLFLFTATHAQDFDMGLQKIASDISKKIDTRGKTKVAVWGFFTENGETTALGNYITEDFSVYLTNSGENFQVIDRNHLDVLLREHELNAEGYVDGETAKELGKIIAVDAIVTGTYTVLNSVVKVRAKVLDTETALQFVASMGNLPLNKNIASYLGIGLNGGNTTNRGFNTPLNSNETVNNPETVNAECRKKNTGDFCFSNTYGEKIVLRIKHFTDAEDARPGAFKTVILDAKETKCVYGLTNRPFWYYIASWKNFEDDDKFRGHEGNLNANYYSKYLMDKGELKVETCTSKTYTIR